MIMWRYRNTLDSPGLKKTGFDVKVRGRGDRKFTFWGVVSDFVDFDGGGPVVGGRVAWAMGGLELGGTVVMDTDQLSAVPDSIRAGLARDPFGAFGVDAAFPILKGPSLAAAIYGGASRSVKGDGGGTALGGPGIKVEVGGATVQAEYRWVEGRFIPGYFDALYERNRAVVDPVTGQVTTREATLTDLSMRGFFGHAEVSLGPLVQAEASYQYLDTEGSGDHRIQGHASLKQALPRHLRKVSKAEAYYENHRRGASHYGLFDATSETRFGYRLVVEPLPRLSILWEIQFTYEPDEAGGFQRRRLLNLQSIIRL